MDDKKELTLPYLLVAFAGRMLANKDSVMVPIEALEAQGYDTEVLVEMIAHYKSLRLVDREFAIQAKGGSVSIRRLRPALQPAKPAAPSLISHPNPTVPASPKKTEMAKPLVSLSVLARQSAPGGKGPKAGPKK